MELLRILILLTLIGTACKKNIPTPATTIAYVCDPIVLTPFDSSFIHKHKALNAFLRSSSANSEDEIAAIADSLHLQFKESHHPVVGKLFARKLRENNPLYHGRGTNEVTRLRAYLLASWAAIGSTKEAFPIVMGALNHGKDTYLLAAAVRVAAQLDFASSHILPLLTRLLGSDYHDDLISFSTYKFTYPLQAPTSLKLEVINAFSQLNGPTAERSALLKSIAEKESHLSYSRLLSEAANEALAKLVAAPSESALNVTGTPQASFSAPVFTTSWAPPTAREENMLPYVNFQDHTGRKVDFKAFTGKPCALTFFYSSCSNPNKCSETIFRLAELQKEIARTSLRKKINLMALTIDPFYDIPSVLANYGKARDLALGKKTLPNTYLLRTSNAENRDLLKNLNVNVNYGMEQISLHQVEMILLDKKGRIAKKYIHTTWQNDVLIKDLERLARE